MYISKHRGYPRQWEHHRKCIEPEAVGLFDVDAYHVFRLCDTIWLLDVMAQHAGLSRRASCMLDVLSFRQQSMLNVGALRAVVVVFAWRAACSYLAIAATGGLKTLSASSRHAGF